MKEKLLSGLNLSLNHRAGHLCLHLSFARAQQYWNIEYKPPERITHYDGNAIGIVHNCVDL